ncbi:undecaprenyl-diphosphatase [Paenibacillus shirakamiensis]|uniref:Undecaprenyl-diphosphatase n=1 Tax=Paenibacillus shirakamiensis TaxID=1265935 RepID=A0ABS4JEM9_9BACL|nr:undecaprenyl-diphosphatase [Paenibacillus shirakamiensis]MBP2000153.1 undecaprenyl-diphosphatase [Paenibacillus shirakamiensis]
MSLSNLDYLIFQKINELGYTLTFLNPLMIFFASYAQYIFFLGVILYWFTRGKAQRMMTLQACISAIMALICSGVIGHFFYRDRPFVHHAVLQLIPHPANASFPSDHAIGAFVIATSIWIFRKKEGGAWLILASGIAFSRVWTGVHYLSDVIGGALIGIAVAYVVHALTQRSIRIQHIFQQVIIGYQKLEHRLWPSYEKSSKELFKNKKKGA